MYRLTFALSLVMFAMPLQGATLERLSLDDMIEKSTAIVRGTVTGSHAALTGNAIYTHYRVQVLERLKGPEQGPVEFVVPGGTVGRITQTAEGNPRIAAGREYLLFLWTSRTGLTYIIGLSQGVFNLPESPGAEPRAVREAPAAAMLEPRTGRLIRGERIEIPMRDLRARIGRQISKGAGE